MQSASAEDQWFCREGASRSLGDVLETCGIGKSKEEATARKSALDAAFDEFDRICKESVTCRDYEKTVVPMRTECLQSKDEQFTCYRAVDFTVTSQKKSQGFDDKDKKDAVVSAMASNDDGANPILNGTATPPPPVGDRPVVYSSSVHYGFYDPYVYVISAQPQVVYVRSQLPPQYAAPSSPSSASLPVARQLNHRSTTALRPQNSSGGHRKRGRRRSFGQP
jgi:hypothetical protein